MTATFSSQYDSPCVTLSDDEGVRLAMGYLKPQEIIDYAKEVGATYEDEPGSTCYVVEFPGRPQELYTESALRRSGAKGGAT